MSKKTRILISCILVVFAFAAGIFTYIQANGNRTEIANADGSTEYFVDESGKIKVPEEPKAGATVTDAEREVNRQSRGVEGNPFFILEIAPYEGVGQFAYHVSGQEPVDIDLMAWDSKSVYGEGDLYSVTHGVKLCIWEQDYAPKYTGGTEARTTQYGIMRRVTDGSGTHRRSGETIQYKDAPEGYTGDKYRFDASLGESGEYVLDASGTFMKYILPTYVEETGGAYRWEPLSVEECLAIAANNDEKATYEYSTHEGEFFKAYFENVRYYYKEGAKVLTHNDYFLRESVGLAYDIIDGQRVDVPEAEVVQRIKDYRAVVYTVTPEDLNQNLDLIDRADMITFVTKDNTSAAVNAYEANGGYYLREGKFTRASSDAAKRVENVNGATFNSNQLGWEAVVRMYERVNDEKNPCPVLWDSQTYGDISTGGLVSMSYDVRVANNNVLTLTESGTQNNLYKLYLLLYQMPAATFEMLFGSPEDFDVVDMGISDKTGALKTGVLKDVYTYANANRYWNQFTFYPWSILPDTNPDVYGLVLDSLGIMNNRGGALFAFASGGSQNFIRNFVYRNDGGTWLHSEFMDPSNVADDQYGHEVYDFFESIGEPKTTVTSAECLYYLLNGLRSSSTPINNEVYRILELQPSPSFLPLGSSSTAGFWDAFVASYTGSTAKPVVTQMTTSEFIGKNVDCIADFDLVYIGMNKLATDPTMHTNFTYAHTGRVVALDGKYTVLHDWLNTTNAEANRSFAYSGNDLTKLSKQNLVKYANSGAALVFGYGFFTSAAATTMASSIDRNSYIYDLPSETSGASGKVYEAALSNASTHVNAKFTLKAALNKSRRVEMEVLETPNLYVQSKTDAEKYINGSASNRNNRTLRYRFKLNAPSGIAYTVALYVDINGDGKFTDDENMGANVNISGGGAVSTVQGGNTYVVTKTVEDRIGSVSWKLDIVRGNVVYDSISGVSAIKAADDGSNDIDLCILQIVPERRAEGMITSEPVCSVYLPQEGEVIGDEVIGLPAEATPEMKEVTKKFYDWTRYEYLNGMNITFVRKNQTEVNTELTSNANYLKNTYDMIIIGFADVYEGITLTTVSDAITDFIGSGRAVLFTHDTASLIGPTGEGGVTDGNLGWGANYTKAYRDIFAMDRYDVLLHGGAEGVVRADYPYVTSNSSDSGELLKVGNVVLAQGFSNGILQRYETVNDNLIATKVTQVNTGAITEYPYKIGTEIPVAQTHAQYYQLDMERNDIVVWYCLDGSASGTESIRNYYTATPNDVRNNYYIYNAGNVTYSGVGHNGNLTDEEIKLFINTFVAAYRAAARPVEVVIVNDDATKDSSRNYHLCVDVNSSNADIAFGNDIVSKYWTQKPADDGVGYVRDAEVDKQSKRVYFRIQNNNLYGAKGYDLTFYLNGATEVTPLAVFKKDGDVHMDTRTAETKFKATNVDIYYVDVPLTVETNAVGEQAIGDTELMISVVMTYGDENYVTDPSETKVSVLPRGMFDLD